MTDFVILTSFFGAPGERTFQQVKVLNPPGSGKDIAEMWRGKVKSMSGN